LGAVSGADQNAAQRLDGVAGLAGVADLHAEALAALDGGGDDLAADRGLDGVVDAGNVQPVARGGLAVGLDLEVRLADDAVGIDRLGCQALGPPVS
jgi:hypothetical protein